MSYDRVRKQTQCDSILLQMLDVVPQGPLTFPIGNEFQPYRNRRNALKVHQNCLLWVNRVIIPTELREEYLTELHRCYPRIVRIKSLTRSHVWWPNIVMDIEYMNQSCLDVNSTYQNQRMLLYILGNELTIPGKGFVIYAHAINSIYSNSESMPYEIYFHVLDYLGY